MGDQNKLFLGAHPEIGWFLKQQILSILLATFFFPASQRVQVGGFRRIKYTRSCNLTGQWSIPNLHWKANEHHVLRHFLLPGLIACHVQIILLRWLGLGRRHGKATTRINRQLTGSMMGAGSFLFSV